MGLDAYVTLGHSGLRVSPMALGTLTFGTDWGWGADVDISRQIWTRYREAGGNFIDTANIYNDGSSERMVGRFLSEGGERDAIVLATKFSGGTRPGDPNAGGNGAKSIHRSLRDSLERLGTDYVDLYWMHHWDTATPVDEVVRTLDGLVAAGLIRYYGLSDVPAWYLARAKTLAERDGRAGPIALQPEYSLVERTIEREHLPAAQHLGIGVCPWGAVGGGFLTGKYSRDGANDQGRLGSSPGYAALLNRFTERDWPILEALVAVAERLGRPPAQVAMTWAAGHPGITAPIIGARTLGQLDDALAALELELPPGERTLLDRVSAMPPAHPYNLFTADYQQTTGDGGTTVRPWSPGQLTGASDAPASPFR
jgi:aryl-alcohol dehydrogenase-like predicted oxidoreductase